MEDMGNSEGEKMGIDKRSANLFDGGLSVQTRRREESEPILYVNQYAQTCEVLCGVFEGLLRGLASDE